MNGLKPNTRVFKWASEHPKESDEAIAAEWKEFSAAATAESDHDMSI